jgi:RNA polymerase sigma-70 factor, ECF subfamily
MASNAKETAARHRNVADVDLTRAAAGGDPNARRALVDRLFDRVRRTASYLSRDAADAEDLAQTALVRILGSAGGFEGESSLERWADRVTVLTAAKELEKRERRARLFAARWDARSDDAGPEHEVEANRIRAGLVAAFGRLSAPHRAAMALHYINGYGLAEVAELVDAPLNTVRGRLRAGREHLRKIIAADPLLRRWVEEQTT